MVLSIRLDSGECLKVLELEKLLKMVKQSGSEYVYFAIDNGEIEIFFKVE